MAYLNRRRGWPTILHPSLTTVERAKALKLAVCVKQSSSTTPRKQVAGHLTLTSFARAKAVPISSEELAKEESSGSRKMGKFDVDSGEIGEFKKWLTGIEGKKRSEREA